MTTRTSFSNRIHRSTRALLLGALTSTLCLTACTSGDKEGDDVDTGGNGLGEGGDPALGGARCEVKSSTVLDADEVSSLGFSARQLFDAVSGSHTLDMRWGGGEWPTDATLSPASGQSSVTIDVVVDEASAKLEDLEAAQKSCEGACPAIDPNSTCNDRITFQATVHVTTDGGAIDDTFALTFAASSANLVRGRAPLEPGELNGSFDITLDDPKAELRQFALHLAVAGGAVSGKIDGVVQVDHGDVTSAGFINVAEFPVDGCDSDQYLLAPSGALATAATAALTDLASFDLKWPGGQPEELNLTHSVTRACLSSNDWALEASESVVLYTTTTMSGAVEGEWPLEAHLPLARSGELTAITLQRQAYMAVTFPGSTFVDRTGITAVSVDASKDATFSFSITDELEDELAATGELTVIEVGPAPDCSHEIEYEYDEDGNVVGGSANGCDGTPFEELASATIRAR